MIRDVVSLHACYFEQENVLIGAWGGEKLKNNKITLFTNL